MQLRIVAGSSASIRRGRAPAIGRGAEGLARVEQRERELALVGPGDEDAHTSRDDEHERARLDVVSEPLTLLVSLEPERVCDERLLIGRQVVEQRVTEGYRE